MTASEDCIAAIKQFEGYREKAYQDLRGRWTVGHGYTIGVGPTTTMTASAADHFLRLHVATVDKALASLVKANVNQAQWDALADFTYNVGVGEPPSSTRGGSGLTSSTLLRLLNDGDFAGAAAEFPRWCHVNGRKSSDLENRRLDEQAWFLGTSPVKAFIHV